MMIKSFLFTFLLLVASCVSTGVGTVGRDFTKADFEWIQIGVTTRDQVVARHGSPTQVTSTSEGQDVMVYTFMRSSSKMQMFAGVTEVDTQQKFVQIFSDPAGVVTRWHYTGSDFDGNASAAAPKP